jgi:hypothetical protein
MNGATVLLKLCVFDISLFEEDNLNVCHYNQF